MQHARTMVALLVMTLLWPALARGQDVGVSASVTPQRGYVGDLLTYTISIRNAETQTPPNIVGVPGLDIEYLNASTNSFRSNINGRRSTTNTQNLMYQVTPMRAGDYVIPAQTIMVDGTPYRTNQAPFRVIEPPVSDQSPLTIKPERGAVYVGEPIRLTATWRIGEDIKSFRFLTENTDGIAWTDGPQPSASGNEQRVQWDDETLVGVLGRVKSAQGMVTTLSADRWFIPLAPGEIKIGPVSALYDVLVGRQSMSIFQRNNTERRMTRSNVAALTVKPLPSEGRPSDFDGLVGRYAASASATPKRVRVGDPITLTYEVRSEGPMGRVGPPDLTGDPGVIESFKLDPGGWEETSLNQYGVRRYTTTIRALRDSITSIPSLGFSYFDTRNGEYRRAASAPIPLRVEATREVTAADAIGGSEGQSGSVPGVERKNLGAGPGGILANVTSHKALINQQTLLLDRLESPVWIAVFAAPPLGYFAMLGVLVVGRSTDPRARRRALARRAALAKLRSSGDAERAIRTYLAMRFDRDAEALTEADCRELLVPVDALVADELAGAMLAGAGGRYGAGDLEPPDPSRIARLLRTIDKEARR